jgi:hypothetical protein
VYVQQDQKVIVVVVSEFCEKKIKRESSAGNIENSVALVVFNNKGRKITDLYEKKLLKFG